VKQGRAAGESAASIRERAAESVSSLIRTILVGQNQFVTVKLMFENEIWACRAVKSPA
jgi:hypothetical protein